MERIENYTSKADKSIRISPGRKVTNHSGATGRECAIFNAAKAGIR